MIAPDGTATVAWDQSDTFPGMRYAEFRAGSWGESEELPDDSGFSAENAELDLAATPSGRRLLAWVAVDGIRALVDGSPPVLIVPTTDSASVSAAIAEDGTAVVAYSDTRNRLLAVDRTPDGTWSAPRVVGPDGEANVPFDRTLTDARFSASVAPNGTPSSRGRSARASPRSPGGRGRRCSPRPPATSMTASTWTATACCGWSPTGPSSPVRCAAPGSPPKRRRTRPRPRPAQLAAARPEHPHRAVRHPRHRALRRGV